MSDKNFYAEEISTELFYKMRDKSYAKGCKLPISELRHIHFLHKNLQGESLEGEMVCNQHISDRLLDIFYQLYELAYPMEKFNLIDEYNADDEISMTNNNGSCFNYRLVAHTNRVSKHGLGLAVDINPLYNPYIKNIESGIYIAPVAGKPYVDRDWDFDYKIIKNDPCYELFIKNGFEWGGDWEDEKDYQHFEIPVEQIKKWYPDY
ncbi:MAG: M15 family metallopeptidase [Anaerovibrio sp.]|uniref:M15 family metallopeptidase n=1 Tax=Anaerovibrio sp. TaxID=1872532 RepID=UPI0025F8F2DF|nr:M15 family metallopeptidase [Anaerovibrio sp.]MCR5176314.1 M15 family metallopeptidase [Anaerovibrio sp.]